jgi:hypothetical protein
MNLDADYAKRLKDLVARSGTMSDKEFLLRTLVAASVWRSKSWAWRLAARSTRVRTGPFKDMDYVVKSAEGALLPRLLGIYERELHPDLLAFAADPIEKIIDVGCAEGYYAVGLARLMPHVTVHAFDLNETARRRCGLLAEANGVRDRVIVSGEFAGADFEAFRGARTLVFCDAEGFEDDLFQPEFHPALKEMDVIVETHPMAKPGVTERLMERFTPTHDIKRIAPAINAAELPAEILDAGHIDMTIACWEWRAGPTPWLVMRSKARGF